MKFLKWTLAIIIIVILARLGYILVTGTGMLQSYVLTGTDNCQEIPFAAGPEDITIDHKRRQVFVSADDRRASGQFKNEHTSATSPVNGIYMFSLDNPSEPMLVSHTAPLNFHPHGIYLWHGAKDERKMFVVSHLSTSEHVIELFDVAPDGTLAYENTFSHPLIHSPNDLVATGVYSFYVTNDHGWSGFMRTIENFLGIAVSNVVYFDNGEARVAIDGLAYANGINKSPNGQTLYVAEITKRHIRAWHKNPDQSFTKGEAYPMRMAADNIELDEKGRLWTAGHPNVLAFLRHAKDSADPSPSMASVIDTETNTITEVLYSDGSHISGASVAAASDGAYFVGAVFDERILSCSVD